MLMEKNKIIILALVVVIVIIIVGIFLSMPHASKTDTKLSFKSNSTIDEGDSIKIKLTDENGTALANQTVNVTITDKNKFSDYHSLVTNSKGIGTFKIDKSPGKYDVMISYGGNDKYNSSNASQKITIKEIIEETAVQEQSSDQSSSSSERSGHYSPQFGRIVYDDEVLPVPN